LRRAGHCRHCRSGFGAYPTTPRSIRDHHFDAGSDPENPRWIMVDMRYKRKTRRVISLAELKQLKSRLRFALIRQGNRLSVMPVSKKHWSLFCPSSRQQPSGKPAAGAKMQVARRPWPGSNRRCDWVAPAARSTALSKPGGEPDQIEGSGFFF
jgi:hypothetical protein